MLQCRNRKCVDICEQKKSLCAWMWYRFWYDEIHSSQVHTHTGLSLSVCTGIGMSIWQWLQFEVTPKEKKWKRITAKKNNGEKKIPERMRCVFFFLFTFGISALTFSQSKKFCSHSCDGLYIYLSPVMSWIFKKQNYNIMQMKEWVMEWWSEKIVKFSYFPIYVCLHIEQQSGRRVGIAFSTLELI